MVTRLALLFVAACAILALVKASMPRQVDVIGSTIPPACPAASPPCPHGWQVAAFDLPARGHAEGVFEPVITLGGGWEPIGERVARRCAP
jgi:hypothetical protein